MWQICKVRNQEGDKYFLTAQTSFVNKCYFELSPIDRFHVFHLSIRFECVFKWSRHRPWSMTSTLSWWKMPVWACVSRFTVPWNRAVSSWMKQTKRAWKSSVSAVSSGSLPAQFSPYFLLTAGPFCYSSRNCGSAGRWHIWPGVQSVEEQRVRVPELQETDRSLSLCPTLGEVSGHGPQQQSHRQPQVSRPRSFGTGSWVDTKCEMIRLFECGFGSFNRLASNNNMSKSESDQEDNDDLNDNDWSYGAEKKGELFF